MAFSKVVLLVVFTILLISTEVSALRDLAETTTTPTTDSDARGSYPRVATGGNIGRSVACNRARNPACKSNGGKGGNGVPKCNGQDPTNRACYRGSNGGKGGNGEKGGRGGYGLDTTTILSKGHH